MDQSLPTSPLTADIAIIGAGAAGLSAAIFAGEECQRRRGNLKILLLDGAKKPGAKILVSGGGRCNVTNVSVTEQDYCGGSPNIIRNVLRRFDEHATVRWMESLGIELKTEPTGKLFPVTDSARTVLEALMQRVREVGVGTRFGFRVADVRQVAGSGVTVPTWSIRSVRGDMISARRIIMATGGKALPKSGSDGTGYAWLERLGHTIVPPVPALAPLILDERGMIDSPLSREFASLSGLTINARLSFAPMEQSTAGMKSSKSSKASRGMKTSGAFYDGSLLFTHFGLSGPTAMNLSRHIARFRGEVVSNNGGALEDRVAIGFELPGTGFPGSAEAADQWLLKAAESAPRISVAGALARALPERLAQVLASAVTRVNQKVAREGSPGNVATSRTGRSVKSQGGRRSVSTHKGNVQRQDAVATVPRDAATMSHHAGERLSDLTRQQRQHLAQLLFASPLAVKGDRGFSFAEATAGGVALDEISWRTMESRKAAGLFLCGEVLDVDGRIGGFNFQWAWASGHIAGTAAVQSPAASKD